MNDHVENSGFVHHKLKVYREALGLLTMMHRQRIGSADLRRQGERAMASVVLNIAEGATLEGAARKRHYRIARASLVEAVAAYEVALALGQRVDLREIHRRGQYVGAMLTKMIMQ